MSSPRVRRLLIFLLGYVAAAPSAAVALVLYGSAYAYINQSGQPLARAQTLTDLVPVGGAIVGLLLATCLPFAWIPLTVGLTLWCRLVGRYRLLGCLVVGTITGVTSLVWFGVVVAGIARAFDYEMTTLLPDAAPMGAFGGLMFWAIAFRRGQSPPCSGGDVSG